ncbi:conserved hypothetical protein [Vibrio phage 424E50-1]|nr:conserved hypothetical protein [Vibrio phage 424E50-1]
MSKELTYEVDEYGVFIEEESHEAAMDNLEQLFTDRFGDDWMETE